MPDSSPMERCLACGRSLEAGETGYHARCAHPLFGSAVPPSLGFSMDDLNRLARDLVLSRSSVPGVQAKLSVHLERQRGAVPARLTLVGLEGGYILKLPSNVYPELPEAEHFCMMLARSCGIQTEDFGLVRLRPDSRAFLARRLDRTPDGPLHMEDFCQLTEHLAEEKYRGSMEQVAKALRAYSSAPGLDAIRLYGLTLFCFLTGNSDMHLKNFSLLRRKDGTWDLSPAYDLVPVSLLLPSDHEELALSLNGKKNRLLPADFSAFARSLGLTDIQREHAEERLFKAFSEKFEPTLTVSFLSPGFQDRMRTLAAERLHRFG